MDRKRAVVYGLIALLAFSATRPRRLLLVVGNSMAPTYRSGELVWTLPVDRPLRRGDVVVVNGPEGKVMKRVALLGGDRHLMWRCPNGTWVEMLNVYQGVRKHKERTREEVVPNGTIYVLGDHLESSIDSRDFGPVRLKDVCRIVEAARKPDETSDLARSSSEWRVA